MHELIEFTELHDAGLLPEPPPAIAALLPRCLAGEDLPGLARSLAGQPSLASALARLAGRDGAVDATALAALGPQAVHQLTLALGLLSAYRRGPCSAFDYPRHWSHALATACAAQQLAATGGPDGASATELFCAGLLAGCGRLALATGRPRSYARLLRAFDPALRNSSLLLASERARYGYHHLRLGAAMLRRWHAGPLLAHAVRYLEEPERGQTRATRRMAWQLQLAARMALVCATPAELRADLLPELAATGALLELDIPALLTATEAAGLAWSRWCVTQDLPCSRLPRLAAPATFAAPAGMP